MSLPTTPDGTVLGYRIDLERHDELRAHASPMQFTRAFAAPREIDPRPLMRVEDQRSMGSCCGQSMSSDQEYLTHVAGEPVQLSAMFAYLAGQSFDGLLGQDNGATITGSVRGATELGNCLETTFPYPTRYLSKFPPESKAEALARRIQKHDVAENADQCHSGLASGAYAIQIGTMWTEAMANTRGVIDVQHLQGRSLGGHAQAVLGYLNDGEEFLVLNSHGTRYGESGWARWTRRALDYVCKHPQCEVVLVTEMTSPTPRRISFLGMRG